MKRLDLTRESFENLIENGTINSKINGISKGLFATAIIECSFEMGK